MMKIGGKYTTMEQKKKKNSAFEETHGEKEDLSYIL